MGNNFQSYINCRRPCFDSANYLILMEDIYCEVKAKVKKKKKYRVGSFLVLGVVMLSLSNFKPTINRFSLNVFKKLQILM